MRGKEEIKITTKTASKEVKQQLAAPDTKKRLFLKLLGVVGLGFVGSLLVPKKADAYVFGSTPTSNVVGVKNIANTRVNPATQETLALVATEATLASIKTNSDKFTFDGSGNLLTASSGGASVVGVKNASDVRINPATQESVATIATNTGLLATEESTALLRRIVRQIDSLAVVDSAQRQKITIDSITGSLTLGTVSTVTTVTTVTTVSTVTSVTNLAGFGGVDPRFVIIDNARNAYANGIRQNL